MRSIGMAIALPDGLTDAQAAAVTTASATAWYGLHDLARKVVLGGHVIDLSGIAGRDQAMAVARTELDGVPADTTVLLVAARK